MHTYALESHAELSVATPTPRLLLELEQACQAIERSAFVGTTLLAFLTRH